MKHGHASGSGSKEYQTWNRIIQRCHNPKKDNYPRYGGVGITVCERWRDSFEDFLSDMGLAPSKTHTIERTDSTKGYYKENCKWATYKEQANNRRSNHLLTHDGVTMNVSQWVEKTGISKDAILGRIKTGWSVEKALTTPTRPYQRQLIS